MNIIVSLLALLCVFCNAANGVWWNTAPRDRDCLWAQWSGTKCEQVSKNTYRIQRRRTKIPKLGNGKDCVGSSTDTKVCNEAQFVASTFYETIGHRSRGKTSGGNRRTGSVAPFAKGLNPCTPPHYDASGGLRMIGKECETKTRLRRSAEGLVETFEEPLQESPSRMKRQILSTKHRDILFLVDESGSVGKTHYELELEMVSTLVSKFCGAIAVGKDTTRVGIMTFDWTTHVHLDFDKYFERHQIVDFVDKNVPYTFRTGNRTCLIKALKYTRTDMIKPSRGARNFVPGTERVVVLITDGCANCENQGQLPQMLKTMRKKFEDQNIAFITFFIGKRSSCVTIMGGLADGSRCYQVFRSESWTEFSSMINQIKSQPCMDAWIIGPSCT